MEEGFATIASSRIDSPPSFVKEVLLNVSLAYDEGEVLRRATKTSAMIVAAVFGPKDPPSGLPEKYTELKSKYNEKVSKAKKKAYIASLMSMITGLSLAPLIGLAGFFVGLILPLIIGPITFKVASRDRELHEEFRKVKEEAEWYGIE